MLKKLLINNFGDNMYIPMLVTPNLITDVSYDATNGSIAVTTLGTGARTCYQKITVVSGKRYIFYGDIEWNAATDNNIRLYKKATNWSSSDLIVKITNYAETNPFIYTSSIDGDIYIRWYSFNDDFVINNFTIKEA